MRCASMVVIVAMGQALANAPVWAAEILGQPAQVTATDRVDFAPGGLIRIDGSYGTLNVEAWDRPQVEVTATKSLPPHFGDSRTPDSDTRRLGSIQIKMQRVSATEVTIATTLASRNGTWVPPLPPNTTNGVIADYEVHVPRDSRLEIRHGTGFVQVTGVAGDIDASAKRGDILLWLPGVAYAIDAKTRFGTVSSEFGGATVGRFLIGQRFRQAGATASHRLRLRMGSGGITIRKTLPESDAPASINGR